MIKENSSILIVDDNPQNIQVLGTILHQNGYNFEFGMNGESALEWINSHEFDLVLLDVMMPEMDGFKVCEKIKANPAKSHIPIIFLTARTDMDSLVKAFEQGAVDYITKPFNKNELLARVNTHLQLKHMTDMLKVSLEKEKELSQLKTSFVSIASHEFRTPLTSIMAVSEIIKKYSDKMTKEEINERIDNIQAEVNYMTDIMEDILILGKADSNKLEFNPANIDLIGYIRELINEFDLLFHHQRKIILKCKIDKLIISIDKKWMKHIFNNLISNAFKYSDKDTDVLIEIQHEDEWVKFFFTDKGIGIPKQDLELLFDSFYRAGNVRSIPGTGLGLSVVKKAVNLHKGSISVKSIINKGTTFEITIPVNQS